MSQPKLKIGTRGSKLALAQAYETRDRLMAAHGLEETDLEIVVIKTSGDKILDRPLADIGGKGLFTKEIEEALYDKRIDLAVHSMKDMPAVLPPGLVIAALLPREDPRDAFVSLKYDTLGDLPQGARFGTSSVRRAAQLRQFRPDLEIVEFRGNLQTRLQKLKDGVADGTFLACAGLIRLDEVETIKEAISIEDMLPAVAQGAIGIEVREDDETTKALIAPLNDHETAVTVAAERGFLIELDGSCRTPLAAHARLKGNSLSLKTMALTLDGSEVFTSDWNISIARIPHTDLIAADAAGRNAAADVAEKAGDKLFA